MNYLPDSLKMGKLTKLMRGERSNVVYYGQVPVPGILFHDLIFCIHSLKPESASKILSIVILKILISLWYWLRLVAYRGTLSYMLIT